MLHSPHECARKCDGYSGGHSTFVRTRLKSEASRKVLKLKMVSEDRPRKPNKRVFEEGANNSRLGRDTHRRDILPCRGVRQADPFCFPPTLSEWPREHKRRLPPPGLYDHSNFLPHKSQGCKAQRKYGHLLCGQLDQLEPRTTESRNNLSEFEALRRFI